MTLRLSVLEERFAYRKPFRITGYQFTETSVLVAEVEDGQRVGRGEAAGVYYFGDDVAAMTAAIEAVREPVEAGVTRAELQELMPPGGARNALDCALWDLEAKRREVPAWQLAGMERLAPLKTTFTVAAASAEEMAEEAVERGDFPRIKLKLTGEPELDVERIRAVRAARPDCWLAVDANQGYDRTALSEVMPALLTAEVRLIEQPLPRGAEAELDGIVRPIPFAADESVCTLNELERAAGRFDVVNIKLDKCGGLTEGLAIARACRALGIGVMVGNMMGTSLSMAPSMIVGQLCDVVDLDGPLFLREDRADCATYENGLIDCSSCAWGMPAQ